MKYVEKNDASLVREKKTLVVDRELEKLYEQHGTVSTEIVLDAARNKKHPLHKYFEWDDSIAGEKWRQSQALQMIMASKMVVILNGSEEPPRVVGCKQQEVRRLVSAFRGEGFKMRKEALDDEEVRKAVVDKKKEMLRSWCRGVVDIDELKKIREMIERMLD